MKKLDNHYMILSFLFSLAFSWTLHAEVPQSCSNLSAVTCADGVRDDGTGVSLLSDSASFAKKEFERMKPTIRSSFAAMLTTPQGKKLTPLAAEACLLKTTPECRNLESASCQPKLSDCLSRLYQAAEMNPDLGSLYSEESKNSSLFNAESALRLVQDPSYVKVAHEITKSNLAIIPQELKDKVEKQIFPDVQQILRKRIAELPVDEQTRKLLDKKISTIKFGGIECESGSIGDIPVPNYSTRLGESLYPNAQFDETKNHFQICPAFLRYTSSEFDLAATIAHELAHSIDPCSLGGGEFEISKRAMAYAKPDREIEDEYLRKNFISCFRSPSSIGAKEFRLFDPPIAEAEEEMIADDLNRLCQQDQINETLSDWFAAEALAAYIPMRSARTTPPLTTGQIRTGLSNVYRMFCSKEYSANDQGSHPATNDRINSIFLVQPKLRALMGCPASLPGKRYCDIQNPATLIANPQSDPLTPSSTSKGKAAQ